MQHHQVPGGSIYSRARSPAGLLDLADFLHARLPFGKESGRLVAEPPAGEIAGLLLDPAGDGADGAGNATREGSEDADDGQGDHTQHDGVLGHRLTLLALARPLDQLETIRERHFSCHLLGGGGSHGAVRQHRVV